MQLYQQYIGHMPGDITSKSKPELAAEMHRDTVGRDIVPGNLNLDAEIQVWYAASNYNSLS
ncbi:MAG: hypothetical protein GY795_00635 [Desulfobacterales bacterium]|nr:hypothetical protein [Desulfobacterales bacterium]